MKKYLRFADVFVLFTGALGLLLRLMVILGGTDDKALYPANHPAWIIACVLTVAVVAALWLVTRQAGDDGRYEANFPRSVPGAIGCALGGLGIIAASIAMLKAELLAVLCCILGLCAGVGLFLAAYARYLGKKPHWACFALPCGFFVLRVFLLGQTLGAEPEAFRYLFEALATLALVPACYQLWGFTVDMGRRHDCLFWCLTAAYLAMVAVPDKTSWLLHLTVAAWLMTNLCPLRHMPKKLRHSAEAEAPAVAEPEETAQDVSQKQELESIDVDAILAEILAETNKEEKI